MVFWKALALFCRIQIIKIKSSSNICGLFVMKTSSFILKRRIKHTHNTNISGYSVFFCVFKNYVIKISNINLTIEKAIPNFLENIKLFNYPFRKTLMQNNSKNTTVDIVVEKKSNLELDTLKDIINFFYKNI